VIDSREADAGIRRRRECSRCGYRFTTYERTEPLRCPYCSAPDSKVTGWQVLDGSVRRYRECLRCGQSFTSTERADAVSILVIKRDGRREEFNRNKVLDGIRKACAKRPVSLEQMEAIVKEVEEELLHSGRAEVSSTAIGEIVVERLRHLDPVAYIRFASVYRPLDDLESFRRELEELARSHDKNSD